MPNAKQLKKEIEKKTGIPFAFDPNPIQEAGWSAIGKDENILVATSAGSGKTFFLETAMALAGDGVYITPTKALVEQKFDDWSRPGHPFAGRMVVKTGDHPDEKQYELESKPFRLMTPEAFGSAIRNVASNKWIKGVTLLALDEIHHVASDERGHKEEAALVDFFLQTQKCRIVAASATLPNAKEYAEWFTRLNARKTFLIESAWRPQPLHKHYIPYTYMMGGASYFINEQECIATAFKTVQSKPTDKWIVFVHTKNAGWRLFQTFKDAGITARFHNADLSLSERKVLEKEFTHGNLNILIATSTVAAGCNFPARNVAICGVHRGRQEVEVRDMIQMSERAGRPGFDPEGDAFFILPSVSLETWKQRLLLPPPAMSQLEEVGNLAFHIVAGIAKDRIHNEGELKAWFEKTLAFKQGAKVDPQAVVERLISAKAVVSEDGKWEATSLGRAAANFYFDPFDILSWYMNFVRIKSAFPMFHPESIPDAALAWAIGSCPSGMTDYIPKDCQGYETGVTNAVRSVLPDLLINSAGIGVAAAYACLRPIKDLPWSDVPSGIRFAGFNLQSDAERIRAALCFVDSATKLGMGHIINGLMVRIKYRVPWEAVALCGIPGIGTARSLMLLEAGIGTPKDILDYAGKVEKILGKAVGEAVVSAVEDMMAGPSNGRKHGKHGFKSDAGDAPPVHQWSKKKAKVPKKKVKAAKD